MGSTEKQPKKLSSATRWFLLVSGFIAVALGVLGIFLPVLPTVPFLLLAAACFTRSSDKFYHWLIDHAHLGPMVQPYLDGEGLKRSTKGKAIGLLWASIAISIYLLGDKVWVQGMIVVIASCVTVYLLKLPTPQNEGT